MHPFDFIAKAILVLLALGFCVVVLFFAWHLFGVFAIVLMGAYAFMTWPRKDPE